MSKLRRTFCLQTGNARRAFTALALGAACAWAATAPADDWPQWQGPNRDAMSAERGLLQECPEIALREHQSAAALAESPTRSPSICHGIRASSLRTLRISRSLVSNASDSAVIAAL